MTHVKKESHSAGRALAIACTVSFICFMGSYMRIPIVPLFAASLGADSVQVGLVNSAFMLMAGAFSIPAGLLSDRFGRRIPILGALLLLAASSILLYWSKSALQMGEIYLFFGIGLAAFSPTLMSYVADVTPPQLLGQAYGWYTMAVYGGMTVGPAAGGFLAKALGLRQVFLAAGGLIFLTFLVALVFLPLSPQRTHQGPRPAILPALAALRHNRPFVGCLFATLGTCFGFGSFVTFMPLYLRSGGMHSGDVGFVFGAQALANAISRLPSGRLGDRVRDRSVLVAGGMAFFAVALAVFGFCRSLLPFMANAALMGVSMGFAFTAIGAMIADSVPRQQRGLAMGCYNTCVYAGMMLSAGVTGGIIRSFGYPAAFFVSGGVGAATLLVFLAVCRRRESAADAAR